MKNEKKSEINKKETTSSNAKKTIVNTAKTNTKNIPNNKNDNNKIDKSKSDKNEKKENKDNSKSSIKGILIKFKFKFNLKNLKIKKGEKKNFEINEELVNRTNIYVNMIDSHNFGNKKEFYTNLKESKYYLIFIFLLYS